MGCGRIADFEDPAFNDLSLGRLSSLNFQVRDFSVHVRGLCEECSLQKASNDVEETT